MLFLLYFMHISFLHKIYTFRFSGYIHFVFPDIGEDGKRNNAVVFIPNEKILYPYWTNRSIISGLISYLRIKEGRSDIPTIQTGWIWSVVRGGLLIAWGVNLDQGYVSTGNAGGRDRVALASAL